VSLVVRLALALPSRRVVSDQRHALTRPVVLLAASKRLEALRLEQAEEARAAGHTGR
jgi:hypothetical protein